MDKKTLLTISALTLLIVLAISSSVLVADVSEGAQFSLVAHRKGLLTGSLSFIAGSPTVIITEDGILNVNDGDTVTINFNTNRGNLEIHHMPNGGYTITMAQLDATSIIVNGVTEYEDTTILGGSFANAESFTSTLQLFISSEDKGRTLLVVNGEVIIDDHHSDDEILLQDTTVSEDGILQVNLLKSQTIARGFARVYVNGEKVSEFPGLMKSLIPVFMVAMFFVYRKFGASKP